MMKKLTLATILAGLVLSSGVHASFAIPTANVTFDDLSLAPDSHFFPQATTTFSSGGASFNHTYTNWFSGCCHTDWIYSNETDTTTAGHLNQFSAFSGAGGGAQGSSNYAIANFGSPTISFAQPANVAGAYLTNTTYAVLSMLNGDSFAKIFGGASGNDADWLKLTILGMDASGANTSSIDFYLADYRFADNSLDYIVTDWTYVDLSTLGPVSQLQFALASSDSGLYGINTPAYFAMDSMTVTAVPEPENAALLLSGVAVIALARRRQSRTIS